jgi:hypothetical protein
MACPTRRRGAVGSTLVFEPGVEAAEDDGWKGDQKIKEKPDGDGNKNQRKFNRVENKFVPSRSHHDDESVLTAENCPDGSRTGC